VFVIYDLIRIFVFFNRSFCLKTGIQILLREYSFDSKNRFTFFEEDIVNMFPVVKHINPRVK